MHSRGPCKPKWLLAITLVALLTATALAVLTQGTCRVVAVLLIVVSTVLTLVHESLAGWISSTPNK